MTSTYRYVAVGDSLTEGLSDFPDGPGTTPRGWADHLAVGLATRRPEQVEYANLAIRGRLIRRIVDEQVPRALDLRPNLVSLIGGGNDLIRPGGDPDVVAGVVEEATAALRAAGVDVLLGTGFDSAGSPIVERTRGRTAILNAHLWAIARRHDASVLDMWGMRSLRDWRMWAADRIHLDAKGHWRVSQAALVALGHAPDSAEWDDPLEAVPLEPLRTRLTGHAAWARTHMAPWIYRRLRGRSSGDTISAKIPAPVVVDAATRREP